VRETRLSADQLISPLFVREDIDEPVAIASLPGHNQNSLDSLEVEVEAQLRLGIRNVLLFGVPEKKDAEGSQAWAEQGIVQRAMRRLRDAFGRDLTIMADLCLCEYTDHGHCGVLQGQEVLNDPTLRIYQRIAVSQAEAGADVIAPSGMMDRQVAAIRESLDENGFSDRLILAYAVKFASAFYGPFREAAGSTPQFGDRRAYQMDPANGLEALREAKLDIEQGADMVMVKPALPYLDVIRSVSEVSTVPVAAYNVSGEFAMLKAAAARGWIDERRAIREVLLGIRRAGASMILTYHAKEAAAEIPCWEEIG
jgi:porphobilinogen synthase